MVITQLLNGAVTSHLSNRNCDYRTILGLSGLTGLSGLRAGQNCEQRITDFGLNKLDYAYPIIGKRLREREGGKEGGT